jgi:chromosome partitioning protein
VFCVGRHVWARAEADFLAMQTASIGCGHKFTLVAPLFIPACGTFRRLTGLRHRMCQSITVMNAKGGVGKTTLVLAMAETLSAHHDMKVLVIDSDAHASLSTMLLPGNWLATMQAQNRTFVDYLIAAVLKGAPVDWRTFAVSGVSDVDDARTIELLLGGGHLMLFEREVSKGGHEADLRHRIRTFLAEAREVYDLILIDSAPGLSVLTECWLREADFCLSPAKPDYLSTRGLQFLQQFGERDTEMGFAENLGVIISMKDPHAPEDEQFDRWLRHNLKSRCFKQAIPRTTALQTAAYFSVRMRSYGAKYPGKVGRVLRELAVELLDRLAQAKKRAPDGGEDRPRNGAVRTQQVTR